MSRRLILGVDGGGTSTTAWLADEAQVLGRGVAGPSNIKAVGAVAAKAGLDQAIARAFADACQEVAPVSISCLGLAGFDRPEDRLGLEEWAGSSAWGGRLILLNDGDLVVAAGTPEGWGVGVIAGTGSIAVGRSSDGWSARAGGWGSLLGDEGSAYAVALAGLRLIARRADGRAGIDFTTPDALTPKLCEALGIKTVDGLVTAVYREDFDRARIAALAPLVVAAAEADSAVVSQILEPAGFELALMVAAVARQIGEGWDYLPLAMAGSFLLNCPVVSNRLQEQLIAWGYKVRALSVPDPVEGALILAWRALNP